MGELGRTSICNSRIGFFEHFFFPRQLRALNQLRAAPWTFHHLCDSTHLQSLKTSLWSQCEPSDFKDLMIRTWKTSLRFELIPKCDVFGFRQHYYICLPLENLSFNTFGLKGFILHSPTFHQLRPTQQHPGSQQAVSTNPSLWNRLPMRFVGKNPGPRCRSWSQSIQGMQRQVPGKPRVRSASDMCRMQKSSPVLHSSWPFCCGRRFFFGKLLELPILNWLLVLPGFFWASHLVYIQFRPHRAVSLAIKCGPFSRACHPQFSHSSSSFGP